MALLPSVDAAVAWLHACGARGLVSDHRRLQPGDAFIAWRGATHDARRLAAAALAAGAAACLVDGDGADALGLPGDDARIAALGGLKALAGPLASAFLGHPTQRLVVLAVTGTNGKTSTAWWLAQALSRLGRRCGVVGTLGTGEPPQLESTGLTTPDAIALQTVFRRFADAGFAACAIEASSIGIAEQRLAGTAVKVAVFTNFTRDHLDHHGTMDAYWAAKAALFDAPGLQATVVNVDDERGAELAASLAGRAIDLWTISAQRDARLAARSITYRDGGLAFEVCEGAQVAPVRTALIGEFNVANLLGVIGGLRALGVPLADAATVCSALTPVPGRMQGVASAGAAPEVVVDYAHTPDALEKALAALRPFARQRGGRLWCVFGCGGNRDASKRPLMGAIAERLADHVVVTSDNPRDEAPAHILAQILVGVIGHDDVDVIEDRRAAIAHAVAAADARDVILIAGKGHEDYQEVAGLRHSFSDAEIARTLLAVRASGGPA
ncbi:MAG: UDP-N-acetylmuramoyl-L-alanyl-D-glutamate--2,6-diaminopimelate ligase [Ideonella sp.]|nr:UDP-N-acetylmuramoyl-L-alanyl-D-glutamate--2,6-diaminopimelate ligase [Ideonella sp.]